MKLLFCNTCEDIVKLSKTTSTCRCGATGGHYKQDGVNAVYYGPAVALGFANSTFIDAISNQPEYGMGIDYKAFVIPKVCSTMVHIDIDDYEEVVDYYWDDGYDELMEEAELEKKQKKLKNVFKDEN